MTFMKQVVCVLVILGSTSASYLPEHHDLHHHGDLSGQGFDLNDFPPGSLPSASFTGSGLIENTHEFHNGLYDSGINYNNQLNGGLLLGQVPGGPNAPVINEIHSLANSNGAYTKYNIRDETYQVVRDVPHHVPHPVPVPVPQKIEVPVPQPYPVPVVKNVPVPVLKIQHVKIDKPVPVPVEKIVHVPVERVVEVPVEHEVPVERIVEVPVVNVIKVPVHVVKQYPVPVVKTVHHYVKKHDHHDDHHKGWW